MPVAFRKEAIVKRNMKEAMEYWSHLYWVAIEYSPGGQKVQTHLGRGAPPWTAGALKPKWAAENRFEGAANLETLNDVENWLAENNHYD